MTTRFWELLAKYWSGSISGEEKAELDELLLQHPGDWLRMGQLDQLTFEKQAQDKGTAAVMDKVMNAISAEQPPALKKGFPSRSYKWSLLALMGVIAALLTWLYVDDPFHPYKVVATEAGMKTKIRLPDGSIIWLNAGSTLKYPEKMDMHKREVYLTGEAFFDITKNARSPSIVIAGKQTIEVLGTQFNIRYYQKDESTATTLVQGSVRITAGSAASMLKPGQQWLLDRNGTAQLKQAADVDMDEVLAWRNGKFIFNDTDLKTVINQLERWYDVKIDCADMPEYRFNGEISRNVALSKVLKMMELTSNIHYKITDRNIYLTK